MKITEEGKEYVTTKEFAQRLGETVESASHLGKEVAVFSGALFTAMCLAGFARCGCRTMCREQMDKFDAMGGPEFYEANTAVIQKTIYQAACTMGIVKMA
jgi:hypothetical protein